MQKTGEPVIIYRAATAPQANLLKNLLEDRGISAWVENDLIQAAAGELPVGWRASAQVVVRLADAEEGRRLALEFDKRLLATAQEPAAAEEELQTDHYAATDTWRSWPRCPECGEQRHTQCPLCLAAGDKFPLVDLETTAGGERVLLSCQDCDEPFRPRFYRLCHRCGHDFGDGIRVESPKPRAEAAAESGKVWLIAGGMTAVGGALLAYFAWLLSR